MPLIKSHLEPGSGLVALPVTGTDGKPIYYIGHIIENDYKPAGGRRRDGSISEGESVTLTWELDSPDSKVNGRKIPFDNINVGGMTRKGDPMPLGFVVELMNAIGAQWTCEDCGASGPAVGSHYIQKNAETGDFFCQGCESPNGLRWVYNSDDWTGGRCRLQLTKEKMQDRDDEINRVKRHFPIS